MPSHVSLVSKQLSGKALRQFLATVSADTVVSVPNLALLGATDREVIQAILRITCKAKEVRFAEAKVATRKGKLSI